MDVPGQLCARARFWASLRVDGELSELEGALLDAHLSGCAACREVVAGFAVATRSLRAAPLAQPSPVSVHLRRAPRRFLATAAVAVVVLAGAIAGGLVRGQATTSASSPRAVAVVASVVDSPDQLRRLRRTALLNQRRIPRDMAAEPV
jgi:anti-sigma factor RsiW